MIHHTPEGAMVRIGLNFRKSAGGLLLLWASYDFVKREAVVYRLRLNWNRGPRYMWAVNRWNVVEEYARTHSCELVSHEVLNDLKAAEGQLQKINDPHTLLKPV